MLRDWFSHARDILWRKTVWVLGAVYTGVGFFDLMKSEFLPAKYQSWTVVKLLPDWQWRTWAIGLFALLLILAVQGSLETHRKLKCDLEDARSVKSNQITGPQPCLEYSAQHAQQHTTYSGLFARNCGDKSAFKTTLICDPMGKLRLRFDDMPIQRIDPGNSHPVRVYMEQLGDNGIWCSQGGTLGMQIEMCFERMDNTGDQRQRIPVTIKYFDYEGKREYTTRWFIRRDGEMFADKRIWCEMAQAAGSTS